MFNFKAFINICMFNFIAVQKQIYVYRSADIIVTDSIKPKELLKQFNNLRELLMKASFCEDKD